MTISDKIRIYELSRDLNLENKDILDAAQKLSISVKSHSSSISAEEAKKIKNLINKKNSDKKILSIKKPSIKKENYKQNKENESSVISSMKGKPLEDNSKKKPLLIKPLNKPESQKIISNKPTILNKPTNTNSSQSRANLTNKNINSKPSQNLNQDKKTFANNTTPPIKSPAKPPIQLIAKPKNINNNVKSNLSSQNISNSGGTKQILNKQNILSYEALITNSVSTTRSINESPSAFEDIFIRLDSYDVFFESDFMRSELSTVEALDNTNSGLIPLAPSIKYSSQKLLKNNRTFTNDLNIINLKRNESNVGKPSNIINLKTNNSIKSNHRIKSAIFYNKINLNNNIAGYEYEHNPNLDDNVFESDLILSSDIFFNFNHMITPRVKFIQNLNIIPDDIINEDSKALTFNYHNQYADNRLYGIDQKDNSSRIVYGVENKINLNKENLYFNLNQSYDFNKDNNYVKKINQTSNFSDLALEVNTNINNIFFKIDSRLSNKDLEKKEMNYFFEYSDMINLKLNYNETNAKAFDTLSSDTQFLGTSIEKKLNENVLLSLSSDLDLKNNYSPLKQVVKLSLFDECSKLDISYIDERFNDNYNTKPSETINVSLSMDYLGFFGYEQKSNVFFEKTGKFNYGD